MQQKMPTNLHQKTSQRITEQSHLSIWLLELIGILHPPFKASRLDVAPKNPAISVG